MTTKNLIKLADAISEHKPSRLPQGTPVKANGHTGTIIRHYQGAQYEIRLPGGVVTTDDFEVIEAGIRGEPTPRERELREWQEWPGQMPTDSKGRSQDQERLG